MRALIRVTGHELLPTLLVLTGFLLAGCTPGGVKPDLPAATLPVETETVRQVFVPIKPELTVDCAIADGPVSAVIEVARQRKESLQACNGRLRQIRAIQGTPATP